LPTFGRPTTANTGRAAWAILAILILETVEDVLIFFVELIIREALTEGLRPLLTLGLIKAGEAFC